MARERLLAILAGTAVLLAACGGGTPTAAPGQPSGPAATTGIGPTDGAEPSDGTEPTEAAVATPGGGPSTAKACNLLTPDEVSQATGYEAITVQPIADSDTDAVSACLFMSQGVFPAVTVAILDPANTNTDPAGYLALPGSEELQVSGARAIFVPAAGYVTFIIKGSTVATLQATPAQGEPKDAAVALVQKIVDRL